LHDEADTHPIWAGRPQAKIAGLRARAGWIARRALQSGLSHLHAHFGSDATTAAMLAARAAGIGYSFTAHARDIYHGYVDAASDAAARRHKISQARFVATVTEFNRRHLVDLAHGQFADIRLLYNGIDLQRFRPDPDRITEGQRILAIGRLVAKKGFDDLIDACALLRQRDIDFQCDIIGEGPLRDALHARIADLGLEGHVRLLGARTQGALVDEIRGAAVTTLPCVIDASGDRDALPTVLIESLAMAVPVVTTTINGCPEIIGEDEAGWLVAPNAPRQLADALAQALLDANERRIRGRLGRIRCENHFDAQRNACRLAGWFAEASLRLPSMKHPTLAN